MFNIRNKGILCKAILTTTVSVLILTSLVSCSGIVTKPPDQESGASPAEETQVNGSSDKIPGANDFMPSEEPPEGGAVLSSPAIDMFLKIEGVPGESSVEDRQDWIEVLSYSHGVSQTASGAASTGGTRSAGRCEHQDFSIAKTLDKASPKLALLCSNGQLIDEVILVLCDAEGDKNQYMEYTMTDVIISSVSVVGSAGTELLPVEEVTFNYGKIQWCYTEYDSTSGKAKGDVETFWDVGTNEGG